VPTVLHHVSACLRCGGSVGLVWLAAELPSDVPYQVPTPPSARTTRPGGGVPHLRSATLSGAIRPRSRKRHLAVYKNSTFRATVDSDDCWSFLPGKITGAITKVAMDASLAVLFAPALLFWLLYNYSKPKRRFPPGPKGLPIIGSLLDINNERPWITYGQWASQYGELHANSIQRNGS
jgi:hypothetical protein